MTHLKKADATSSGNQEIAPSETGDPRLGFLPPPPTHGFVGRAQELEAIEKQLTDQSHVVLKGPEGQGKTSLATALARHLLNTQKIDRVVFVKMERYSEARALLDMIGRQVVPDYSVTRYAEDFMEKALEPVEQALGGGSTLMIIDDLESVLVTSEPIYEPAVTHGISEVCSRLGQIRGVKLLLTAWDQLPKPFDQKGGEVEIGPMTNADATVLLTQAMAATGLGSDAATADEISELAAASGGHARTLTELGHEIRRVGIQNATENLSAHIRDLQEKYPGEPECLLFASIGLSLERLSPETREKIGILGVFQNGAHLDVLRAMLNMDQEEIRDMADELILAGLAEHQGYGYMKLRTALCPYLLGEMDTDEIRGTCHNWAKKMMGFAESLYGQIGKSPQLAASLSLLELPNLLAALEHLRDIDPPEKIVDAAANLETLFQNLGRPQALARVAEIRKQTSEQLGEWGHSRFEIEKRAVERSLESGQFRQAREGADALLTTCLDAGPDAYEGAVYDIATACLLQGSVLGMSGAPEAAIKALSEAQRRFRELANAGNMNAVDMASSAVTEMGNCLLFLGHLDEAAEAYEDAIARYKGTDDLRHASCQGQLGTVRMHQKRYEDAVAAHESARDTFERLDDADNIAIAWHNIARVHKEAGAFQDAERAYRSALNIALQHKNRHGEAFARSEMGSLYAAMGQLEVAVAVYHQAAETYVQIGDMFKEGTCRDHIADTLIRLNRSDEARQELERAIECKRAFGHVAEIWKTWDILQDLEQTLGNAEASVSARAQAMRTYLESRRTGRESQTPLSHLCALVAKAIQEKDTNQVREMLEGYLNQDVKPWVLAAIRVLQAVLEGSRDASLAENPELDYMDAAELTLLLEHL